MRSLLKKVFSGQPDNVLRPIREILKINGANDFPIEKLLIDLKVLINQFNLQRKI